MVDEGQGRKGRAVVEWQCQTQIYERTRMGDGAPEGQRGFLCSESVRERRPGDPHRHGTCSDDPARRKRAEVGLGAKRRRIQYTAVPYEIRKVANANGKITATSEGAGYHVVFAGA